MAVATVEKVLEELNDLSLAEREYVAQIESQRIIEEKREYIRSAAIQGKEDYKAGKLKVYDNIQDLRKDLDKNYSHPTI